MQVALEGADVLKALVPDALRHASLRQLLPREKLRMHAHHERLLVVAAVENADASALRQLLHAAPEIIVIEVRARRPLERRHLAALRIHARHHVLDRPVFPRRIHRLEDEEHRPAILRVKHVLQFRERLHPGLQRLLRARLVLGLEFTRVARIDILQSEFLSIRDAVRLGKLVGCFDDLFGFHMMMLD